MTKAKPIEELYTPQLEDMPPVLMPEGGGSDESGDPIEIMMAKAMQPGLERIHKMVDEQKVKKEWLSKRLMKKVQKDMSEVYADPSPS